MRPGWAAGATRSRLLLSRAIGADHAREIAACRSLSDGVGVLAGSAYGERLRVGTDLVVAERAVAETLLWHLRILAGWLPGPGAAMLRALAAWFELANVDARLAALAASAPEPVPFELGGLATAWPMIESARSVEELADRLSRSAWSDPGGRSPAEIALGLRVEWARRVRDAAAPATAWVGGAAALLVTRELLVAGSQAHAAQLRQLPEIGERALAAASLQDLQAALPPRASWVLRDVSEPSELWRAELDWWLRVEFDARAMLQTWGDEPIVLAAVALLAVDAQRTARALRTASQGGESQWRERIDGSA